MTLGTERLLEIALIEAFEGIELSNILFESTDLLDAYKKEDLTPVSFRNKIQELKDRLIIDTEVKVTDESDPIVGIIKYKWTRPEVIGGGDLSLSSIPHLKKIAEGRIFQAMRFENTNGVFVDTWLNQSYTCEWSYESPSHPMKPKTDTTN
jgi:hypothetical protein